MNGFLSSYGFLILLVGGFIAFRLYRKGKGQSGHMGCGMPGHMRGHGEPHGEHESQPTGPNEDPAHPSATEHDPADHSHAGVGGTPPAPPARHRHGC
jgi:hypothetical protein